MQEREDLMEHLRPRELGDLPIEDGLHMLTCALFYEWRHHSSCEITPPYTLKKQDYTYEGVTYRSAYQVYMKCNTEYEAAITLLGSWPHWEKLCKCKWFHDEVEGWRQEMDMRDNALAKEKLVQLTKAGNVTAARTLLKEGSGRKAGAPSRGKRDKEPVNDDLDALLNHADNTKERT